MDDTLNAFLLFVVFLILILMVYTVFRRPLANLIPGLPAFPNISAHRLFATVIDDTLQTLPVIDEYVPLGTLTANTSTNIIATTVGSTVVLTNSTLSDVINVKLTFDTGTMSSSEAAGVVDFGWDITPNTNKLFDTSGHAALETPSAKTTRMLAIVKVQPRTTTTVKIKIVDRTLAIDLLINGSCMLIEEVTAN